MTYHSNYNFTCSVCGLNYIPFKAGVKCPKCGSEPKETYDIISEAIGAWFYHAELYGQGTPPFYAVTSLGDHYIHLSCIFLDKYVVEKFGKKRKISIEQFTDEFLPKFNFQGHEYLKSHYREYFKDLLERFEASVTSNEREAEFLMHIPLVKEER